MDWPDLDTGTCRAAISLPQLGHPRFTRACLDESVIGARRPEVREFVPFDDRWFDDDPPGALVPLVGLPRCKNTTVTIRPYCVFAYDANQP